MVVGIRVIGMDSDALAELRRYSRGPRKSVLLGAFRLGVGVSSCCIMHEKQESTNQPFSKFAREGEMIDGLQSWRCADGTRVGAAADRGDISTTKLRLSGEWGKPGVLVLGMQHCGCTLIHRLARWRVVRSIGE